MTATATTDLATRAVNEIATTDGEWSVQQIVAQTRKIQECMAAVMVDGEHYGVIPGTSGRDGKPPKKTLLKPGAEKLCLMFRLCPEYETLKAEQTTSLVSYTVRCRLTHIPTGNLVATGLGSCNSRESKYVRPAPKKCPKCQAEALIFGKPEYEREEAFKGGMMCFAKKGGCGAKYKPGDEAIDKQPTGIADPSDLDNTILKMACKRSLVAAALNATAASDCFTQDLEDLEQKAADYTPPDDVARGAHGAPVGGNVPVPSKAGRGSWPKEQGEHRADKAMREMDQDYARTVNGHAPSDLEATLQRSIDANTVEVVDGKTGEVTKEPKATAPQLKKIHAMSNELNISEDARKAGMLKYYKVNSSTLLTKAQAQDMIDRLEMTKERASAAIASLAQDMGDMLEDRGDAPDPNEMEPA